MWRGARDRMLYVAKNVDSSLLPPEKIDGVIEVSASTLDSIIDLFGLDRVDLLEVEAEDFEPEVIDGASACLMLTRFIAVDHGPERLGQSTYNDVDRALRFAGFSLLNSNLSRHRSIYCRNS